MATKYKYLDDIIVPIIVCDIDGNVHYYNNLCVINGILPAKTSTVDAVYSLFEIFPLNSEQIKIYKTAGKSKNSEITMQVDGSQLIIKRLNTNIIMVQVYVLYNNELRNLKGFQKYDPHSIAPFFTAFDLLDDLIHITDQNGCIVFANNAMEKLFGGIRGRYCYEIFSDHDNFCPHCKLSLVLEGNTVRYEVKLEKNGQIYDVINSPFKDFDDKYYKISIMRNLQEIVDKQNTLLLFQNAINKSRNLVCFANNDGTIFYANDTFIKYFGSKYKNEINVFQLLQCSVDGLHENSINDEKKLILNKQEVFLKTVMFPIQSAVKENIFVLIASDITDLKILEKKLADERNYIKSIIDQTIDGFFVIDYAYRLIECNPAFLKMFELTPENYREKRIQDLIDASYKRDFEKKINYVNKSGVSQIIEISRSNNGFKYYIISLNSMLSPGNKQIQYYGFVKDITDITQLHKIIENERNYNRKIIETVQLGFVVINEYREIIDYNNAFLDLIGCTGKNVKGTMFASFIKPLSHTIIDELNFNLSNIPFDFEATVIAHNTGTKNVIVSMSRLYDILGNYLGHFAFIRDITHQKKIESKIVQQSNQVIELVNALTQFTANIVRVDDHDSLLMQTFSFIQDILHPQHYEIFVNNNSAHQSHWHGKGNDSAGNTQINYKASAVIQKLIKNKTVLTVSNPYAELTDEDQIIFKNILHFQNIIFIPIFVIKELKMVIVAASNANTESVNNVIITLLTGVSSLLSIVYEKIESVSEQNKMRDVLDRYEKLVAIGRIIAGVAHEINNPLSILQLDISELNQKLDDTNGDKEIADIIASMLEEIQRMSSIVKQLKDYAKPATLDDEIICLNDIFKTYPLKILSKNIQKKGLTMSVTSPKQKLYVQMPSTRLIQVIMNMLTNAEDAVLEKGHGSISIDMGTEKRNNQDYARLIIKDTGIGIKDEYKQLVFEPFFTTKPKEGTGLGLSISYSIIKNYNGEIEINSRKGHGTEVSIYLPLYKTNSV